MSFGNNTRELSPAEAQAAEAMTMVSIARAQAKQNAPAYEAAGKALASLAIAEARGQGSTWTRFYIDMLGLEAEGRKAFRTEIAAHNRQMQAYVGESDVNKTTKRSAFTRLSELTTISKALDVGIEFDNAWPFHYAVGHAREALRSQGAGDKRGRKSGSWMDKFKAYCEKNIPEGEFDSAVELLETMAKLK